MSTHAIKQDRYAVIRFNRPTPVSGGYDITVKAWHRANSAKIGAHADVIAVGHGKTVGDAKADAVRQLVENEKHEASCIYLS